MSTISKWDQFISWNMDDPPFVETERLILRACTREDLLRIYRKDLTGFKRAEGWPLKDLVEALPHFLNDMLDDPSSIGWNAYMIIRKEDEMIVGDIGFKGPPDDQRMVEIGYSIAPGERNRGYATEALTAITGHSTSTGKVRSIIAECSKDNHPSIKVLKRSGFRKEDEVNDMIHWKYIPKYQENGLPGPNPGENQSGRM